jgi:hypothetical protein
MQRPGAPSPLRNLRSPAGRQSQDDRSPAKPALRLNPTCPTRTALQATAAIPEVASVEVDEELLNHSAARSITSRRYGSQPVDALEVLVGTRASRGASQRRAPLLPYYRSGQLIGEGRRSLGPKQSRTAGQTCGGPAPRQIRASGAGARGWSIVPGEPEVCWLRDDSKHRADDSDR